MTPGLGIQTAGDGAEQKFAEAVVMEGNVRNGS